MINHNHTQQQQSRANNVVQPHQTTNSLHIFTSCLNNAQLILFGLMSLLLVDAGCCRCCCWLLLVSVGRFIKHDKVVSWETKVTWKVYCLMHGILLMIIVDCISQYFYKNIGLMFSLKLQPVKSHQKESDWDRVTLLSWRFHCLVVWESCLVHLVLLVV